jgi:predicted transcriptional regulator
MTEHIIELHGWLTTQIPTRATFELSDGAYRCLGYLIFRARGSGSTFVGIERMAAELKKGESTVRKCLTELRKAGYIYRQRRMATSSITHIFERKSDYDEFIKELESGRKKSYRDSGKSANERAPKENTDIKKTQDKDSAKSTRKPRPFFDAISQACNFDEADIKEKASDIGKTERYVKNKTDNVSEVFEFVEWWYANDFRGKEGKPPKPHDIRNEWPAFQKHRHRQPASAGERPQLTDEEREEQRKYEQRRRELAQKEMQS